MEPYGIERRSAGADSLMTNFERHLGGIQAALDFAGGTHHPGHVWDAIQADQLQFWPGHDSFIITELEMYPRRKNCHIFLAGGTLEELERMLPHVEHWAKGQGCTAMTLTGRPGWARSFLNGAGYQAKWQVMAKEIS